MTGGRAITFALLVAAACGSKPNEKAAQELGDRVEALRAEESGVLARTEELAREEVAVREARAAFEAKKVQLVRSGADPTQLVDEENGLKQREEKLQQAQAELTKQIEKVFRKYAEATTVAGAAEGVSRREASVAVRERDVARREEGFAKRETELAEREKQLAARERDTCGAGTTTIVREVATPAAGTRWSRVDVEPLLQKARRRMGEKGVLAADLPGQAATLESEATRAMATGDYGRAKLAADQLLVSVEAVRVDRTFVSAKIGRLNATVKARPPAGAARAEVDELFRQATADYADGKFPSANTKLNRIASLVK